MYVPRCFFALKRRHLEQKLGDCLVYMRVSFTSVYSLSALRRVILCLVSEFKYRMLSYCNLVTRLTNAEMVVKSRGYEE